MPPAPAPRLVAAVAAAGACGAVARHGLAEALPTPDGALPLATLLANLTGCLLLGLLVARAPAPDWVRPVLGAGLLGGWTTWSGLALETDRLLAGAPVLALAYLLLSTVGGAALAAAGLRLGRS